MIEKGNEPEFTGRFSEEHKRVVERGTVFYICTFKNDFLGYFFSEAPFNPRKFDCYRDGFSSKCVVRAYNPEDAVNHYPAACAQMRAWQEGVADYLTAPFRDEQGNLIFDMFRKQVAKSSGPYAATPPCLEAADGIVHPEIFCKEEGFFITAPGWQVAKVTENVSIERAELLEIIYGQDIRLFELQKKFVFPVLNVISQMLWHAGSDLPQKVDERLNEVLSKLDDPIFAGLKRPHWEDSFGVQHVLGKTEGQPAPAI